MLVISDFFVALGLIYLYSLGLSSLHENKEVTDKIVRTKNLNQNCANYLQSLKANIPTASYGFFISVIIGAIVFIILKLSQNNHKLTNNIVYLIVLGSLIISWGVSYKIINCLISRAICPGACDIFNQST